jgi:hypothetical protein
MAGALRGSTMDPSGILHEVRSDWETQCKSNRERVKAKLTPATAGVGAAASCLSRCCCVSALKRHSSPLLYQPSPLELAVTAARSVYVLRHLRANGTYS